MLSSQTFEFYLFVSDAYVDWSRLNGVSQLIGSLRYYTMMRRWYCEENWKQSKQEVGARTGAISLSNCFRPPAATLPLRKKHSAKSGLGLDSESLVSHAHTLLRRRGMHFACLSPIQRQRKSAMQARTRLACGLPLALRTKSGEIFIESFEALNMAAHKNSNEEKGVRGKFFAHVFSSIHF